MSVRHCVEHIKRNTIVYTVMFISAHAFYLRIVHLANHKLWADELYQISVAQGPFIDFIKRIPRMEFVPYIAGDYYLTYPFVKLFQYNKWGLAIPHLVSTILGFYLLYLVCKAHFKTIWGYVITFTIMCFNATLINHATEIRTYAVLPTLALGVFYFSQVLIERIDMELKKKWLPGIFLVSVIWFHPYGIVMVLSCFTYSLATKLHTPAFGICLRKNMAFLFIVFFIAMPLWIFSVFGPHVEYGYLKDPSGASLPALKYNWIYTFDYIPNPLVNLAGFLTAIFGNLVGYKKLYFLLIGTIFPFLIPYKERFRQIGFLFILVFMPIQVILLSDLWGSYWFLQRQFIWVMPLFAFFIGWVWDSFFQYMQNIFSYKQNLHTDE